MVKLIALLFAALKLGKLAPAVLSMLLSIGAYALLFGWQYAVGFVALILVHEMGHYLAARRRGLDVGLPTFIPFVGAWIQLKDLPHDAETEAYVGVAGPLVGTLGALACFYLARSNHSPLLLALAYSGFFLNLFNLIPLSPFDGGRVTAAISPRLWLVGCRCSWHSSSIARARCSYSWRSSRCRASSRRGTASGAPRSRPITT